VGWTVSALYGNIVNDRYEAIVSSVREYEDEDDDGNSQTMYQPTVKFTSNDGVVVEEELGISSGDPFYVGEMHPVSYDEQSGHLSSRSFVAVALQSAGLMMSLLLLGYVIIGFAYAYSIPIGITGAEYTVVIFLFILLPVGMIAMDAMLIYYLVDTLFYGNNADDPAWVLWLVGFFALMLTLAMIGILQQFLKKRKDIKKID